MKVSLITTVKDAGPHVGEFLASVAVQTRPPDEIVVVDGGSTDGTIDVLRAAERITLIEEPGAGISRGRNVAIAAATHDVIAATDADCALAPDWLERLLEPMEAGADVSMGFSRPALEGFLDVCQASLLPGPDELDETTFMPSSRSVAFTREAIEAVGGYPEWLPVGEDMYVDHRWRELGLDMRLAGDALVAWPMRPDLPAVWRQYFHYARGDALAGMHAERHAVRFGVYTGAIGVLASRRWAPRLVAAAAGTAYVYRPIRRAFTLLVSWPARAAAAFAVPAFMAYTDAAKMVGYLAGRLERALGGGPADALGDRPEGAPAP